MTGAFVVVGVVLWMLIFATIFEEGDCDGEPAELARIGLVTTALFGTLCGVGWLLQSAIERVV